MSDIGLGLGQSQLYAMILGFDTGTDTWAVGGLPVLAGDFTEAYNGGAKDPLLYPGRSRYDNITLTRPFMLERDLSAMDRLEVIHRAHRQMTVTFFFEDENGVRGTRSYLALVQRVMPPTGNADATDKTELGVELRVRAKIAA